MTAYDILYYAPINKTDAKKVRDIAESIVENGWNGMPVLVDETHGMMITGSHRLAALKLINDEFEMDLDDLGDVAEDVSDIINDWCEENDATIDDIDFSNLSAVFAGTWVEEYASEMVEW